MPVDHTSLIVPAPSLDELTAFLLSSLKHMNFHEIMRPIPTAVGLGETLPYFWLVGVSADDGYDIPTATKMGALAHFAFVAESAEQVRSFHENAMAAGGIDNGKAGDRPMYGEKYYAAFVKDPVLGANWEMVCRTGK